MYISITLLWWTLNCVWSWTFCHQSPRSLISRLKLGLDSSMDLPELAFLAWKNAKHLFETMRTFCRRIEETCIGQNRKYQFYSIVNDKTQLTSLLLPIFTQIGQLCQVCQDFEKTGPTRTGCLASIQTSLYGLFGENEFKVLGCLGFHISILEFLGVLGGSSHISRVKVSMSSSSVPQASFKDSCSSRLAAYTVEHGETQWDNHLKHLKTTVQNIAKL